MVEFKASKVNDNPSSVDSDQIYLIKKGSQVEMRVSDNTGSISYPLNTGYHKYLMNDLVKIKRPQAGQYGSNLFGIGQEFALGSEQTLTIRMPLCPFFVLQDISIDRVGFQWLLPDSSNVRVSVYKEDASNNQLVRIANVPISVAGTGIYEGTITPVPLKKTEVYYFGLTTTTFKNNEFRAFYCNLCFKDIRNAPISITYDITNRLTHILSFNTNHPSTIAYNTIITTEGAYDRTTPYLFYRVASVDE